MTMASTRPARRVRSGHTVSADTFPAPRFPSGVAVAPTVLLVALLAAAGCLLALTPPGAGGPDPDARPGLAAAITVVCLAVPAFLALRLLVVGPVRRLQRDLAASPVRRSAVRDVDRIAVAVRAAVDGTDDPVPATAGGRRVRLAAALAVVAAVLLGGLAGSLALVDGERSMPAPALVVEGRGSAALAAADLRHALQDGLAGLDGVARAASGPDGALTAAATLLATRPVFRGAVVVDRAGAVVATAGGAAPELAGPPGDPGITQLNTSGAAPVVVASAPLGDGRHTLRAEYDVRALNAALRSSGAPTVVLDPGMRTILSTEGYQAFTEPANPLLRDAVATARDRGPTATAEVVDGVLTGVAAHRVGFSDPAATLGWVVLRQQSPAAAAFAHDPVLRAAAVILGLGAGIVVLVVAWLLVTVVAPLRRLGAHAEAIAAVRAGEPAPEPVAPQRVDEVGAIAAGLNRRLVHLLRPVPAAAPAPARVPRTPLPVRVAPDRSAADPLPQRPSAPRPVEPPRHLPQRPPVPRSVEPPRHLPQRPPAPQPVVPPRYPEHAAPRRVGAAHAAGPDHFRPDHFRPDHVRPDPAPRVPPPADSGTRTGRHALVRPGR